MENHEIALPPNLPFGEIEGAIEVVLVDLDLRNSRRGTLRQYPDSEHWHVQRAGRTGTLELTFWPKAHRLWITVQSGRQAPWIEEVLPHLRQKLLEGLSSSARNADEVKIDAETPSLRGQSARGFGAIDG